MKISIIVPVFNCEQYLSKCLDSIIAQTYKNIEIILIDDGSIDNSGIICDTYAKKDARVRVIHKDNGGAMSARLSGLAEATGEWIGFVDGDDEIDLDMYERLLNNAVKYGAQISHCGYQMRFPDGHVNYFYNTGVLIKQNKETGIHDLLLGEVIEPSLCTKLFHKTVVQSVVLNKGIDATIKNNEDLLMNFYFFSSSNKSVFVDWCPYHYFVQTKTPAKLSENTYKIYDPIKVKEIILEECSEGNLRDAEISYLTTCVHIYCSLIQLPDMHEHRIAVRKKIYLRRSWIAQLSRRVKLLALLVIYAPQFLQVIYPVYAKYWQRKKYD